MHLKYHVNTLVSPFLLLGLDIQGKQVLGYAHPFIHSFEEETVQQISRNNKRQDGMFNFVKALYLTTWTSSQVDLHVTRNYFTGKRR